MGIGYFCMDLVSNDPDFGPETTFSLNYSGNY